MEKSKLSLLGDCPVCGESWRGASFVWIYREADRNAIEAEVRELRAENERSEHPLSDEELRERYPEPMPDDVIRAAAAQHALSNQSRLEMTEDGGRLVCPCCRSVFGVSDFANSGCLSGDA